MKYNFSERSKNAILSPIRVIAARGVGNPDFMNLSLGNPASEAIPVEKLAKQCDKIFKDAAIYTLQYGPTPGLPRLREQIFERLSKVKGINLEGQDLIVVNGSQQGLDIMPRTFCNEGDVILCDEFTFAGALTPMRMMNAVPYGVKMDEDGMIPSELEAAIKKNSNAKYIYIIPNFQNPTGITMSAKRRHEIYDIAVKYNMPIYEDDPYGELLFKGEAQPTIKSFDTHNLVVYAGSFSKTLSAGLRVGFLFSPVEINTKLTAVKGAIDTQAPVLTQSIVSYFMDEFDYDESIAQTREIYKNKCEVILNAIDTELPKSVKRTNPTGGMFVWITMPDGVDVDKMQADLLDANVGIVPSSAFAADTSKPGNSFRINFSAASIEHIKEGIRRVGVVAKKYCD